MAVRHGYGKIAGTDALVFAYDTGDTVNSFKGEPTTNYVPGTYSYDLYAYASGPVDTTVLNEKNKSVTVKRYTITQAVNTARAAIFPTGLTTGVAYTFSFKWRYNGTTTASPSIGVTASKGNPEGGANNNSFTSQEVDTVPIGNSWYLTTYTFIFSSVPTSACILTFGISTGSTAGYVGETFDIYEAQFEIKNHRTQYSNGTRSATQGLLDLTGNRTIDLTNVSFNSSADIEFDGSNDNFTVNVDSVVRGYTAVTFESVHRDTSGTGGATPYSLLTSPNISNEADGFWHHWVLGGQWYWRLEDNVNGEVGGIFSGATPFQTGNWYHVVAVVKTNTILYYLNGTLLHTVNTSFAWANLRTDNTAYLYLGSGYGDSYYFAGNLPVFKMYNKELTADEVRNNYRHYKTRYKI